MKGWEIRDTCSNCDQTDIVGLSLQDKKTDAAVFWCFACMDEHSDWIELFPDATEEDEPEDDDVEKQPHPLVRLQSFRNFKRLPSIKRMNSGEPVLAISADTPKSDSKQRCCSEETDAKLAEDKHNVTRHCRSPDASNTLKGWEFKDACSNCDQTSVVGLRLRDKKTDAVVFWCFACMDQHGEWIEPLPDATEDDEPEDDDVEEQPHPLVRLQSFRNLKRLPSMKRMNSGEPVLAISAHTPEPDSKRRRCSEETDAKLAEDKESVTQGCKSAGDLHETLQEAVPS